ncbi:amino acid ABC transporter substrate-binding protein [Bacillus horti]|uniref:Cystine transport system substrate-binding protein n=1 Tax=Caldalkalibacillus horti TaxID=77523 RepID=A0ABT9VYZ3_9BACI|nr:amino acid ABC transporter substrate-binding protein [Bacillus horti]MDQ0165825.1 cystine transport system substrate-binding protein [Bacillus horti]
MKTSRKNILLFFSLLLTAILVLGCGQSQDTPNEESTGDTSGSSENDVNQDISENGEETLYDKIQAEGKLRIGTEGTYAPFTFHDDTGKLTGFDVEIAEAIAEQLGLEPVFMETQWDGMFAGLDAQRFDLIANQVGIRPDRQEKYDFSDPYITSTAVLVTHEDNQAVNDFEDIENLKAAQTLTSNLTDIARENGAEIVAVEGFNQAIELLVSKRVDITINDGLSLLDFLNQRPETPIKIVAKHEDAAYNGFMFRKGNPELVEAVNEALEEIKANGTYLEISEKWFGTDVSE